ncbi:MAG: DUF2254 domain-containing protein [Allosphingosinicella sp.]
MLSGMRAELRRIWLDLKGSYWFIPSILSLLAAGLSALTIWLDLIGASWWFSGTGWLESSGVEGARSLLTVIASAMIAMASTVFAITIAAVAYASGNYGPRLLTNFMNDRGNQVSLGVFIATFVYALSVLRVVDSGDNDTGAGGADMFIPQLSLFVASLMVIGAVGVLVYFLHHIPASIRINTVVAGIGRNLLSDIEERFPDAFDGAEPVRRVGGTPVFPDTTGYVEIIEFATLHRCAEKWDATVSLAVRTGDFVHPGVALVEVSGAGVDEELTKRVRDAFAIGASRTRAQDLEYLIDELAEIALRALSPGINDPFTAVSAIHWLGAAMASLGRRNLCRGPEQDKYDPERVRPVPDDFRHYLERAFGAIRASAAGSPIASKMFLDALALAEGSAASPERRRMIAEQADLLAAQAETALSGPSLDDVHERLKRFHKQTAASPPPRE